jgi:hypothetical protein
MQLTLVFYLQQQTHMPVLMLVLHGARQQVHMRLAERTQRVSLTVVSTVMVALACLFLLMLAQLTVLLLRSLEELTMDRLNVLRTFRFPGITELHGQQQSQYQEG